VKEYTKDPTVVEFAKHVGSNTPFVVRGYAAEWSCISQQSAERWSNEFLTANMGDTEVSVAVTMDGRADAVVEMPRDETLKDSSYHSNQDIESLEGSSDEHQKTSNGITRNHDTASPSKQDNTNTTQPRYVFATPYTSRLPFHTALTHLLTTQRFLPPPLPPASSTALTLKPTPPILYLQAQNDCLRSEFPSLLPHLPSPLHPSWITSVLGSEPEAINLWIGTRHSVSTLHSDPFENLYVVVRGRKTFWLAPPGEGWFYCKTRFATAGWVGKDGLSDVKDEGAVPEVPEVELQLDESATEIPWYPVPHPEFLPKEVLERYPRLKHRPKAYQVVVKAGDLLYLPRGWLHHVEQEEDEEGLCVAVNSWFDDVDGGMGREWGWGAFVEGVQRIVGGEEGEDDEEEDEEDEEDEVL